MAYSCLHTHTVFCDGEDEVESFCRTAYAKGFESLGFSAHAPIGKKTGWASEWHLAEDRLGEYLEAVRAAKRRWEGRLRVLVGLEIDFIAGLMGPADQDYRELGLDYCIGSVHYLIPPRGAPFAVDGSPAQFARGIEEGFSGSGEAAAAAYWEAEEALIRSGGFDLLGHADLIKKNNQDGRWFPLESPAYHEHLVRAADCIAGQYADSATPAFAVELNTGGLNRGTTRDAYPSLPMLRLLGERGIPIVITADAHRAEHLDGHYEEARSMLLGIGYTPVRFSLVSFDICGYITYTKNDS
jgi:histidinol-phosphatase (PHP family)